MTIGELFLNIGIKGTEKTVGALSNLKKGLGETASMSLEAKAGIVAAMYALERLFAASGATGTGLQNFNATLGISAKTLQQYEYAARQMGVSNQEVEGSFKSLQSTMTKALMGEGVPKGMARFAQIMGDVSAPDLLRFQQNPELLIQKLQEYAQKEKNVGLRNEVLKSFGMSDSMVAAMARNAFTQQALGRAPTYSDKELGALDRANIAWSNLGNKIEMAIGHFNAKHGMQLVSDISKIVDQVVKLADAFTKLAEKLKLFKVFGMIFEGWTKIFESVNKGVDSVTSAVGNEKNKKKLGEDALGFFKEMPGVLKAMLEDVGGPLPSTIAANNAIAPKVGPVPSSGSTQNISVNQNLNFQHDGKDHKKTGDSVKKAIQDSYRQLSAQAQGT